MQQIMKIGFTTLLLLGTSVSHAVSFSNFYAGAQGGIDNFNVNTKATTSINTLVNDISESVHSDNGNVGGVLGLFLGYNQMVSNNFFVGAEIAANLENSKISTKLNYPLGFDTATVKLTEELKGNYNISLVPGIQLNETSKIYAKVGLNQGKFEYKSSGNTTFTMSSMGKKSEWLTGYSAGLGMGYNLTPALSLRLEYNYVDYENTSKSSFDPYTGLTTKTKFSPSSNLVLLGVQYQFLFF